MIGTKFGEGNGSTTFNVPDFRETVLVGAGESTRASIASHDVYSVGEFKDDQFQGHKHNATENATTNGSGTFICLAFNGNHEDRDTPQKIASDGTNGTPRVGSTTHGKQIGVNYIIKY